MKLLTIVIPCYNVEQYLAECLDSILDSKYNDVLEVLAINDGSKDGTLALAREYEARFPEILRVIDKPNGGWGTVINMAIAEASGRYFKILDSDDWFDKAAFAEFMAALQGCEADIFASNYTAINGESKKEGKQYAESLCGQILTIEEYAAHTKGSLYLPMTNITIRKQILTDNHIQLPPRYYGDICYYLYAIACAETVYITNINLYQYRKDVDGQSTSIESYKRNCKNYLSVVKTIIAFYANSQFSPMKREIIKENIGVPMAFAYKLLMSKEYCGGTAESEELLTDYNKYIKGTSSDLYWKAAKITNKGVPYVLIWRLFNINLFKLRGCSSFAVASGNDTKLTSVKQSCSNRKSLLRFEGIKKTLRHIRLKILHLLYRNSSNLPLSDNTVIIAPHPDDEVIGCAGLIQALVERGTPPHVIILTGGEASHRGCCDISEETLVEMRHKLTLEAASTLGLPESHIHTLRYPDEAISFEHPATEQLRALLTQLSPDALFIPHWGEGWSDHVQAAVIAKSLLSDKQTSIYEYCVWMWYYNVWNLDSKNAYILQMPPAMHQRKLEAIDQYVLPAAPCGKPWSGVLPQPFLKAARWNKELYFKSR